VDIAHPILAFVAKLAHGAIVFRDNSEGEAVIGIVVEFDSLVVVLEGNEREIGAENLLANRANAVAVVHAVDEWRQEEAAAKLAGGESAAVEQDLGALFFGQIVIAEDLVDRCLVDHRSREIIGIERVTDAQPPRGLDKLVGETIEYLFMHQKPAGRHTALAA